MSIIEACALKVRLGGREILRDVSFSLDRGTWLGLAGPNGSGKTTLLRSLSGVLEFDGDLLIAGRSASAFRARERARKMAFMRQTQELSFDFSVEDFVLLGRAAHHGWLEPFGPADRERTHEALHQVGLAEFRQRSMTTLSGGEQQRARLAQAMVQDTDILLLDEPTAHLDVHHQLDLMERVRALVDSGRTVISALHDLPLAARFVDRLLVLSDGRVAAEGPLKDVLTEDMMERVFRVRAAIDPSDPSHIRYLAPTP